MLTLGQHVSGKPRRMGTGDVCPVLGELAIACCPGSVEPSEDRSAGTGLLESVSVTGDGAEAWFSGAV